MERVTHFTLEYASHPLDIHKNFLKIHSAEPTGMLALLWGSFLQSLLEQKFCFTLLNKLLLKVSLLSTESFTSKTQEPRYPVIGLLPPV